LVKIEGAKNFLDLWESHLLLADQLIGEVTQNGFYFGSFDVARLIFVVLLEEFDDSIADLIVSKGHLRAGYTAKYKMM
jgi:hypothetical protein